MGVCLAGEPFGGAGTDPASAGSNLMRGVMTDARLIVCEAEHVWSVALTWALRGSPIPVRRAGDAASAWRMLAEHPASVLVLELRGALPEALGGELLEFRTRFPRAMLMTAGPDRSASQWTRQLGAAHTMASTRNLVATVQIIERHIDRQRIEPATVRELVWQRMPWATESLE